MRIQTYAYTHAQTYARTRASHTRMRAVQKHMQTCAYVSSLRWMSLGVNPFPPENADLKSLFSF